MKPMLLIFSATVFLGQTIASPADWPGFGGPHSNFSVPSIDTLGDMPPTVLWSRELGFGNSGIAVRDGIAVTQFRAINGDGDVSDRETVIAMRSEDGAMLWTHEYLEAPREGQNDYGGGTGPHATPFLTADHVFTLGYAGSLHCLDRRTGDIVWKKDLVEEFDAEVIQFGFSTSPVVLDGKLVVQVAGGDTGLVALEPSTGEVVWRSPATHGSYATPVMMEFGTKSLMVYLSRDTVEGIDPEDGTVRWRYQLPKEGLTNVPTPMNVGNGGIFLAGQGLGGAALIRVSPEGGSFKVEDVWRQSKVNFFHNSFVRQGRYVFGGSSFLYGIDLENGEIAWTERGYELANVIGIGDRVLLGPKVGRIVLAHLDRERIREHQSIDVFKSEAWAPPTVVGDLVLARDREAMVALSLTGEPPNQDAPQFLASRKRMLDLARDQDGMALKQLLADWHAQEKNEVSQDARLRAAQLLANDGELEVAKMLIRAITETSPDSVAAYSKLGRISLVNGDRDEAQEAYGMAVRLDPEFQEGRRMLAQLDSNPQAKGNVTLKISRLTNAKLVTVAGSFNGWNPFHTLLRKNGSTWETSIQLPPGEYEYKFVVDGNWMLDPKNPRRRSDGNNNENSLLVVE